MGEVSFNAQILGTRDGDPFIRKIETSEEFFELVLTPLIEEAQARELDLDSILEKFEFEE
jgi:hypothetical protein